MPPPHTPGEQSRSPASPYSPRGWGPRASSTYRVSNIEPALGAEDILVRLQGLNLLGPDGGKNPVEVRSCALAVTLDSKTAAVAFKRRLQFHADQRELTDFQRTGQLVPKMDPHFQGITPVASPWFNEKALSDALERKSKSSFNSWLGWARQLFWGSPLSPSLQWGPVMFEYVSLLPAGLRRSHTLSHPRLGFRSPCAPEICR